MVVPVCLPWVTTRRSLGSLYLNDSSFAGEKFLHALATLAAADG